MNIRKLPSGNYQIRMMENGTTYTLTVDHKPSQREALQLISEIKPITQEKLTLESACEAFIETKKNILSGTTICSYRVLIRQIEPMFAKTQIKQITKAMLQTEINRYSVGHAPKTVKNFGVFLTTVLSFYGNEIRHIQYPQADKIEQYIPTIEELRDILHELEDTRYYVPVFLGARNLRLSEVCALTLDDLSDDNILTIDKAYVRVERGYSTKKTKTSSSTRQIAIPDKIADRIRQQGYVYNGKKPEMITRNLKRVQKKLGITPFTFHQLRHFYASYTHYQGYVDKAIQDDAGWATDKTMKRTYRQGMDKLKMSRQISGSIADALL